MAGPVSRSLTSYTCSSCGFESPRWLGRCTACGEWNTLVEAVRERSRSQSRPARAAIAAQPLSDVAADQAGRISTGSAEFDRVLGGGLVSGSLVLVGGEPGVGKSTLLLQVSQLLQEQGQRVLYVSGEESAQQIKMRAERLSSQVPGIGEEIYLLAESNLEK